MTDKKEPVGRKMSRNLTQAFAAIARRLSKAEIDSEPSDENLEETLSVSNSVSNQTTHTAHTASQSQTQSQSQSQSISMVKRRKGQSSFKQMSKRLMSFSASNNSANLNHHSASMRKKLKKKNKLKHQQTSTRSQGIRNNEGKHQQPCLPSLPLSR